MISTITILGYLSSIIIGITLGLIGGGGSILTVPVLIYLLGVETVAATAYSLFIVGITSAVGSISYFKKSLVDVKTAIIFGLPSIVAVYLTRAYIIPAIPDPLMENNHLVISKSNFLLILFALLMIAASYSMIKKISNTDSESVQPKYNYPMILIEGMIVGILTGLVGAGGGFLIIPALVILSKLPMKKAVGTSLVIIATKSLIGFLGENSATIIDWKILLSVTGFAIIGIFIGTYLSKKIDGATLKPAFGWFVLVMGIYILIKETLFKF